VFFNEKKVCKITNSKIIILPNKFVKMFQPIGPPSEDEDISILFFHHEQLENFGDFVVWPPTEEEPEKLVQVEIFIEIIEALMNNPDEPIELKLMPFEQIIECICEELGVPFVVFYDASKNRNIYMGLNT